jgi:hypothetical protein
VRAASRPSGAERPAEHDRLRVVKPHDRIVLRLGKYRRLQEIHHFERPPTRDHEPETHAEKSQRHSLAAHRHTSEFLVAAAV